jgi:hypothetical protein
MIHVGRSYIWFNLFNLFLLERFHMFTYAHNTLIKNNIDFTLKITSILVYFQAQKWQSLKSNQWRKIIQNFRSPTSITLVVMLATRFKFWSPKTKFGRLCDHFSRQNWTLSSWDFETISFQHIVHCYGTCQYTIIKLIHSK